MYHICVGYICPHSVILPGMGASPRTDQRFDNGSECPQLETGSLVDDFTRRAQSRSDGGSVSSNLTDKGAWLHDITQGTELMVLVFEEGIWITPTESGNESK